MANRKPTKISAKKKSHAPKATRTKRSRRAAAAERGGTAAGANTFRAKIRMYRQGLGDCFLVTLPTEDGSPYYIAIDCGVILGTENADAVMTEVVQDIVATTGGHLNLLAITHEHWDHLSGFVQARELWERKLDVDEVWLAWTEDEEDSLAKKLRLERQAMRAALAMAVHRMHLAGAPEAAGEVTSLLEFFGAARGRTTADALQTAKSCADSVRFCLPGAPPILLGNTGVKAYVLGPPHDERLLKKYKPSARDPETYGMAADVFLSAVTPALTGADHGSPFDPKFQIPLEVAEQMEFFQDSYWGEEKESDRKDQGWRRINSSWLDASSALALQLDGATNNTCLVLALELDGGDVLLFAADAQVGNWLSWQTLSWKIDDTTVTGPDLLHRTIFYKVGHHGSHNATLREKGLEEMTALKVAFVPVDHKMALRKRWTHMPLPELMERLGELTHQRVVRIDHDPPPALASRVQSANLYHEVTF